MPGKPGQSRLAPYDAEILEWRRRGRSYRQIAALLNERYGLGVSHNAVFSYVSAKRRRHRFRRSFLDGLDRDLREGLMRQLVAEWTHDSTAIEGNTLTLGETQQILQLGLTIRGKPLKDHEEVRGHALAIEVIEELTARRAVAAEHLYELHRVVMPRVPVDALNPVGAWKREYNSANGVVDGRTVYMEYASPAATPALMARWLEGLNRRLNVTPDRVDALEAYVWCHVVFVRIHPFFDGNGRLARLLGNLPVMRAGWPPVMVSVDHRDAYIRHLFDYQWACGRLEASGELLPETPRLESLRAFFAGEWERSMTLVDETRARQTRR